MNYNKPDLNYPFFVDSVFFAASFNLGLIHAATAIQ